MSDEMTVDEWRKRAKPRRKEQPETGIKRAIVAFLRVNGWMVTINHQSALSEPGKPDLTAIREGRHVWIEVKTPTGRLSPAQEAWLENLEAHGAHWIVARSVDDVEHLGRR